MSAASSPLPHDHAAPVDLLGSKQVNVVSSDEQYEQLSHLATQQGITLADALRHAIGVASLVVDANANPDTKILFRTSDSIQELKLPR